tara:strand:- start:34263 stop:34727 length:465 start_codon:yes stop_codon:yes gene_type:complete
MDGIKHIIECHCVLPQFRNKENFAYHKFVVFSIIDDSDTVIPKYVTCNNCGVIHKIFDICKSHIMAGKDDLKSQSSIIDIKYTLDKGVVEILESYKCDLPTYENVKFIIDNKRWGSFVVLTKDDVENEITGKMLVFEKEDKFKIESFIDRRAVE